MAETTASNPESCGAAGAHPEPRRTPRLAFALFFLGYAAFSLGTLAHYGPTWDVQAEFPRATAYFEHAIGQPTPSNISPFHRLSYERAKATHFDSVNGCLPSLLAAATGRLFYAELGILGYIDAYHLGLTLLWLLFLLHFHWCLSALHGSRLALLATVLLALTPRLVGHSHNNMKDLPALAFGTAALLELAIAVTRQRPRRIYTAGLLFACGISSKFTAGIVALPALVLLWLGHPGPGVLPRVPRSWWLPLASVPVLTLVVLVGHWPFLWAPPGVLAERIASVADVISRRPPRPASLYPLVMAVVTTPLVVLLGAALAAVCARVAPPSDPSERSLLLFYAAWLGIVLAIYSSGAIALFDGIRHFMLFVPPLTVLGAWGLLCAADAVIQRLLAHGLAVRWTRAGLATVVLLSSVAPVALYHPFEVTYYNALVGGLPGAIRLRFGPEVVGYSPRDYWGTSARQAVAWANENLPEGSAIWISLPPRFHHVLPLRRDLSIVRPSDRTPGQPSFLVFVNRPSWFRALETDAMERGERVHQVAARGVPLAFVYRLPE